MIRRAFAVVAVILGLLSSVRAGGGPENVAVVVNAESWASKAVANEYIALRKIPAGNVIYLENLPSNLSIDVEQFRTLILKPVLETLAKRGLAGQIDCISYSADIPYAVQVNIDTAKKALAKELTPVASVNGLTYLYPLVLAKDTRYISLGANVYCRRWPKMLERKELTDADQDRIRNALQMMKGGKWEAAADMLTEMLNDRPNAWELHYNIACCLAQLGKLDDAMASLKEAADTGFVDTASAEEDKQLEPLRGREDFKKLMVTIAAQDIDMQPPLAFRNAAGWSAKGEKVAADKGMHYMLSTMLAMTSGRGTSVRDAIWGLRRSVEADGTRPKGTVYYMVNGDVRSKTRRWAFNAAIMKLRSVGVQGQLLDGGLPKNRKDIAGLMAGSAQFDFPNSGNEILPGAICEHLTSFGGVMREDAGQTPLSEFLRHGAAGASGTVTEPYAIQAKFPTPFIHWFYASGCTLAESFYQSLSGPYQLLIVGDPLCRPWAQVPTVTVGDVPAGVVKGKLSLTPKVESALPVGRMELFIDGRRVGGVEKLDTVSFDTAGLPDGYHEVRIIVVTADAIETQGSCIVPIVVSNLGRTVELTGPAETTLGEQITVTVKAAGAAKVAVLHQNRELATTDGEEGTFKIPAGELGLGRVQLQAVGIYAAANPPDKGDKKVDAKDLAMSKPLDIMVKPAAALPAIKKPADLVGGLKLTSAGGEAVVVERAKDRNWLTQAVPAGQEFEMEGYFQAPLAEVYQIQARSSGKVQVFVDDGPIGEVATARQVYLPVNLAPGWHKLTIRGTAAKDGLELFFGGPGARSLGADRFSHEKFPTTRKAIGAGTAG